MLFCIAALPGSVGIVFGIVAQNKLVAFRFAMNKIAGAFLFALPLTVGIIELRYSAGLVLAAAAAVMAIQENCDVMKKLIGGTT